MKRQNSKTQLSSSSYRERTRPSSETSDLHAKSVGCMSGIVHLVGKYQNRRKFLITFGKKPEKNIVVISSPPPAKRSVESPTESQERSDTESSVISRNPDEQPRRPSCEAPVRSPTIPQEIRRSCSLNSRESFRSVTTPPPTLVARLMGLSGEPVVIPSESAAERRRKLLGALEKCDQDLKELKKIIGAVRSSEMAQRRPDPTAGADGKANDGTDQEQPSPVSVLDELTRSPTLTRCMKRQPNGKAFSTSPDGGESLRHLQRQIKTQKPGEFDGADHSPVIISLADRIKHNIVEPLPPSARRTSVLSPTSPGLGDHHHEENDEARWDSRMRMMITTSRGMKDSVEQVCRDVEWGERREVGRIGLTLQDHICSDLIEETVKELGLLCDFPRPVIPRLETCKRRLCF